MFLFTCRCFLGFPPSFLIIIKDFNEFRQSNAQFYNSVFFFIFSPILNFRILAFIFHRLYLEWLIRKSVLTREDLILYSFILHLHIYFKKVMRNLVLEHNNFYLKSLSILITCCWITRERLHVHQIQKLVLEKCTMV